MLNPAVKNEDPIVYGSTQAGSSISSINFRVSNTLVFHAKVNFKPKMFYSIKLRASSKNKFQNKLTQTASSS